MKETDEENKVQKTVMVDAVLHKIIINESKKTKRSYSHVLCKAIRKGYKIA